MLVKGERVFQGHFLMVRVAWSFQKILAQVKLAAPPIQLRGANNEKILVRQRKAMSSSGL